MIAKVFNPFYQVRTAEDFRQDAERAIKNGVSSEVTIYYMPLEEVHKKYGKPGDTFGYEPTPQYGSRIR